MRSDNSTYAARTRANHSRPDWESSALVVRERPVADRAVLEPPLQTPKTPEPPAQILTIFRGPKGATGATREIKLTNEFKEDKGHGWLEKK